MSMPEEYGFASLEKMIENGGARVIQEAHQIVFNKDRANAIA
jgi:hypothetical protein